MRTYFKRLSNHPGVPMAALLTVAFTFSGAANENMAILDGMLFGFIVSLVPWSIVLLTAINQPLPREDDQP